jgi:DsbC/DsbD-like thiol-disulfide interchange protein
MRKRFQLLLSAALLSMGCMAGAQQQDDAVSALKIAPPNELTPLTLNAVLTQKRAKPGDTVTVMVGMRLLPGWHTYAYVPADEPYTPIKWLLEPGVRVTATGEWIAPPPVPDAQNPQIKLYVGQSEPLFFAPELRIANNASGPIVVRTGIFYQTCNVSRCLPPTGKTFDLSLTVVPPFK